MRLTTTNNDFRKAKKALEGLPTGTVVSVMLGNAVHAYYEKVATRDHRVWETRNGKGVGKWEAPSPADNLSLATMGTTMGRHLETLDAIEQLAMLSRELPS